VGGLCSASISFSGTERYLTWVAMLALIGAAVIAYLVLHKLHVILPVCGVIAASVAAFVDAPCAT